MAYLSITSSLLRCSMSSLLSFCCNKSNTMYIAQSQDNKKTHNISGIYNIQHSMKNIYLLQRGWTLVSHFLQKTEDKLMPKTGYIFIAKTKADAFSWPS